MSILRLLLLGFYYPPDISAGAFRAQALVEALARRLPPGSELHVITTQPSRFVADDAPPKEETLFTGHVKVTRLAVPEGRGMASQVQAFAAYARKVRKLVKGECYDLVIATSSRLMTAVLGRWVAKRCGARLYQDIRDNFVANLPYVLPYQTGRLLAPFFGVMEKWALRRADCINLVSHGFALYFQPRYPAQRFTWHTNGIDRPFVEAVESGVFQQDISAPQDGPLQVLYAGNLGAGQGIEHILPSLAERLVGRTTFTVIGAGSGREVLCNELKKRGIKNVQVQNPVPREALLKAYRSTDVLLVHLNTLPSLESVLPSKLFEYAATGRPIWAGLAGFPASFVKEEIENAVVFPPGDVAEAVAKLGCLELHCRPRSAFIDKWRRDNIMDDMASEILALVNNET